MLWIELAILLACIVLGARLGGIGLGAMGGIGLAVFVFLFALPPGSPPGTVLGMILAVITALSLMQAAGGLDYVVSLAERLLRRQSEVDDLPRAARDLRPDPRVGDAARHLCAAARDRGGGAQGRRPARSGRSRSA